MDAELLEAATTVRRRAYAPHSGYAVGAALRTAAGTVHVGANVENASFPEGWCAETSALGAMVAAAEAAEGRTLVEVCVIAEKIERRIVTPCGGCRQRLAEFGGPDTIVHAAAPDGDHVTYRLRELLPAAFAMEGEADARS